MACGIAKQKATIHIAIINLIARDNLDIVCCLKIDKKKNISEMREKLQKAVFIQVMESIMYLILPDIEDSNFQVKTKVLT